MIRILRRLGNACVLTSSWLLKLGIDLQMAAIRRERRCSPHRAETYPRVVYDAAREEQRA